MSTFRPEPGPQQPRVNFTPGQPLGIPIPRVCAHQAVYQRDRIEREFLQVLTAPRMTASLALAAPPIASADQSVALRRAAAAPLQPRVYPVPAPAASFVPAMRLAPALILPRLDVALQLELVEIFTPGQALGAPVPCGPDQSVALLRPAIQVQQPPVFATAGPVDFVPGSAIPLPVASRRQEVAQPANFPIPAPPVAYVSPPATQVPAPGVRQEVALLIEALEIFTPGQPLNVSRPPVQMPAGVCRNEIGAILEQIADFPIAPLTFVPRGTDVGAVAYRRQAAQLVQVRALIAAILAPAPVVVSERAIALRTLIAAYQDRILNIEPDQRALVITYLERELAMIAIDRTTGPRPNARILH